MSAPCTLLHCALRTEVSSIFVDPATVETHTAMLLRLLILGSLLKGPAPQVAVASKRSLPPSIMVAAPPSRTSWKTARAGLRSRFHDASALVILCEHTGLYKLNPEQRQPKLPSRKGRRQSQTCPKTTQRPRLIAPHGCMGPVHLTG